MAFQRFHIEQALSRCSIDVVEDFGFSIPPDDVDAIVGLFDADRSLGTEFEKPAQKHAIHSSMAHHENLLAVMPLKKDLHERTNPIRYLQVRFTSRDAVPQAILFVPIDLGSDKTVSIPKASPFENTEGDLVEFGDLLNGNIEQFGQGAGCQERTSQGARIDRRDRAILEAFAQGKALSHSLGAQFGVASPLDLSFGIPRRLAVSCNVNGDQLKKPSLSKNITFRRAFWPGKKASRGRRPSYRNTLRPRDSVAAGASIDGKGILV
jgi:hypothetical protein